MLITNLITDPLCELARKTWDVPVNRENGVLVYDNTGGTARRSIYVWDSAVSVAPSSDKWVFVKLKVLAGKLSGSMQEANSNSYGLACGR